MIGEKAAWRISRSVFALDHEDNCAYKIGYNTRTGHFSALCDCKIMLCAERKDQEANAGELDVDYVFDLDWNVVVVGDRVAYAAMDGRSSALRLGTVIEVRAAHVKKEKHWDSDVPTKLRIQVEDSSGWGSTGKPVLIEAGLKRFVKIS